ncbi:MAG TPA: urea carboxylase [Povalibacter sp.]|uniref:urea carboxylase n=1 Tax=Povalibacter sp. TaxID=1962978 RepID=UPI002C9C14F2|nr:urea carboxylase [Povalibacter sp.]HMN46949.1 urea carboxylase [Povalibacter sp.]
MFDKVLIANRGAIACRILRTLKRLDIRSVAVYSDADRHSLHVTLADEAVRLGPAPAAQSYLSQELIIAAARETGAQAIHPGYGFLSENADFAEQCERAGVAFIGPTPTQMRDFGLKHTARALALKYEVPLLPGSALLEGIDHARDEARRIGFPVMLKSTAGGGGIGMQLCRSEAELQDAFHSVERLAKSNFSQGGVFLEKYVERARHIEVQIFGDGLGNVVALGERDCSVQRRNQKVIEETPAPQLDDTTRSQLLHAAQRLGQAIGYRSAGTVEFVYDEASRQFYFLEVNTRLQVEHGVTEQVTGIDLVEWMIRTAAGEPPDLRAYRHAPRGHSIQVRVYAEDPQHNFRPSSGLLSHVELPDGVRVDSWIETGTEVSPHYDPMLTKIIADGITREEALATLESALTRTHIHGIETNQAYLLDILRDDVFRQGRQYTRYLAGFAYRPQTVEVVQAGTHTTVQDFPGRVGYWDIGVPPSGPMDDLAFRLANRIVGNAGSAAGLECTVGGPTLKFNVPARIALTGARMQAELDGKPVMYYTPVEVNAGSVLKMRSIRGAGQRTYLAIAGGIDVPAYMGSRATFTLGQFGGHAGRALRAGDTLRIASAEIAQSGNADALPIPEYSSQWEIAVMYGPHAAPDFFTQADIDAFFAADWEVHYNSSRTGVRLIGPKPAWARPDGGEAGLHPSNIHDNAYAIGAIDFTGDMPVILGPDGPSLGGFACPATIVRAELWKVGQLRPGDRVRFRCVSVEEAGVMEGAVEESIATLRPLPSPPPLRGGGGIWPLPPLAGGGWEGGTSGRMSAILSASPTVTYRQAGDKYLLVEYGELVLDLELRFRVHSLMEWLQRAQIHGVQELTPGIRSLQIHYDSRVISQRALLDVLRRAEDELPAVDDVEVPSRIVHLPLSWDDPATRVAIDKYMQSVRRDAPWCPSNIEFIRRINGLDSIEDVQRIVFDASYLVMGLGDVYLGAPVATPLDPRHRLVTTKYNPARTWTPENAVGIGGAYLCVYGMEGPGGYQFVGRTIQMWNRYRQTADFTDGRQWLLRFFDQLHFFPVSADELQRLREEFPRGQYRLKIEPTTLKLREYRQFLADHRASIDAFKAKQQAAFDAERERWRRDGRLTFDSEVASTEREASQALPEGTTAVVSPVTGSTWSVSARAGQRVNEGDELLVIEAMKMEIPVLADEPGVVVDIRCEPGKPVAAGDVLIVLRAAS